MGDCLQWLRLLRICNPKFSNQRYHMVSPKWRVVYSVVTVSWVFGATFRVILTHVLFTLKYLFAHENCSRLGCGFCTARRKYHKQKFSGPCCILTLISLS